ncbi:uncharacterized protein EAE97_006942 [Botrytis byssoidea]|uniref:Uncharacterized protein n=1 Tax=Botrytis byssoidea TaxID=139641 RepID=A0A9P5IQD5_9HELO|nr:uncharacterized protein EAE97_006942 [Botrytis byssoidea]KAF7940756.1 hypothetical protein EAE97_006942 [Botrytis byssoidea]
MQLWAKFFVEARLQVFKGFPECHAEYLPKTLGKDEWLHILKRPAAFPTLIYKDREVETQGLS